MKTRNIFAGVAAAATLSACTIVNVTPSEPAETNLVTLEVNDAEWAGTKAAYESGTGVKLDGTEILGLYYKTGSITKEETEFYTYSGTEAKVLKAVVATPDGSGNYTFTAPAAAEGKTWYSIVGYSSSCINLVSDYTAAGVIVSPVQNPGANTFDQSFDYLIGKPFTVSADGKGKVDGFKRLMAPVRLNITDLPAGEKIYTATLAFEQTPGSSTANDALVGKMYIQFGDDPDNAFISYSEAGAKGNAVSAVYENGLEAIGSAWPVWYIVYPATINSSSKMTVTVSTSNATYTKVFTLAKDAVFSNSKLNGITVSLKNVTPEESFTTTFTGSKAVVSNGKSITWAYTMWNAASQDAGSRLSNALNLTSGKTVAIPNVYDKYVTKLSLFTHAANNLSLANDSEISIDSPSIVFGFDLCKTTKHDDDLLSTGGVATVALPSGDTFEGSTLTGSSTRATLVSAITCFTTDGGDSEPVIEEATGNDLYQDFLDGKKITINGVAYTKTDYEGKYDLVEMGSATSVPSALTAEGIHFVTGSVTLSGSNNLPFGKNVILIGRYRDNMATLEANQFKMSSISFTAKNMKFVGNNNAASFVNNGTVSASTDIVLDECTVTAAGAVFRDADKTYPINVTIVDACNVEYGANGLYVVKSGKTASSNSAASIIIKDSKITGTAASCPVIDLITNATAYNPASLVIEISGNTFKDCFSTTALCSFNQIKKFTFTANSLTATPTAKSYVLNSATCKVSETSTVTGNTFDFGGSEFWGISAASITNVTGSESDNTNK